MAVITASTFDPLKTRCNVRLQQGVPIVDADVNELDDIRKFEVRAYLKWYVGDGIPGGSDGFRIDAQTTPAPDDFIIRAGIAAAAAGTSNLTIGLENTGRCIVDGLDVIIAADVAYKAQTLFAAAGPAGLPQIQPIPVIAGTVAVVLDVWERLITAQEDPSLVLSGLGTESCARMRREWCVRTRAGTTVPGPTDADYLTGHSYYLLATIARKLTSPNVAAPIAQTDITDTRHKGLSTSALELRLSKLEQLLLLPSFVTGSGQVVPAAGTVGQVVVLNGRNFNIGTPTVTFGNVTAALSSTPTSSAVSVTVPNLAAGDYSVSITTDGGGPVTATAPFVVLASAPTLAAVNPIVPMAGNPNQSIVITGTNFNQPGLTVTFGATAGTIAISSATQITVAVPNIAAGNYTITVATAAGSVSGASPFVVL
jgi:hypothetical protein